MRRRLIIRSLFVWLLAIVGSRSLQGEPGIVTLGPFGGDVRSLAVHPAKPDRFFLGTADGQVYVSNDRGQKWERVSPGLGRRDLVVDNLVFRPDNPDVLYAATWELKNSQGWLFRTTNGGQKWDNLPLGPYHSAIRAIALAPSEPDVMALGIAEGVILSTDAGKSWERISRGYRSLYNAESMAFDPTDSSTLYVGTWHLGFKTTNRGKKWEEIHQGMISDSDMFSLLVNPKNRDNLYASACTGIYRSDNGGSSWNKLRNGLPKDANRTRTLFLDPVDPSVVYAGTTVGLFVSRDGGVNWKLLLPDIVVNAIAVHPSEDAIVLVGTDDAGILRTTDGGKSFESVNTGFIHRQVTDIAHSPDRSALYAAVALDRHYGGFFLSQDRGRTWQSYNDGLHHLVDSVTSILAPLGTGSVLIGTKDGVYEGIPGEKPWERVPVTRSLRVLDLAAGPGKALVYVAAETGLFELNLRLQKLQKLAIPVYKGKINTVLFDRSSGQLFAGGENGIFRSKDAGKNWSVKVRGLPYTPVHSLEKSGSRLLCGTRQGIFFTDDSGELWVAAKGVFPLDIMTISANPAKPSEVFAADFLVGYLFMSRDGGVSWDVLNASSTRSRISSLAFGPDGELLAGTLSEGVYLIEDLPPAQVAGAAGSESD
ncbi:MAG: hypothetical protein EHM61_13390 [Acidobacteria bacterium]|nr:MAG: hypothetical protein EHM61_13390 [Acidobacteriota bacterium]